MLAFHPISQDANAKTDMLSSIEAVGSGCICRENGRAHGPASGDLLSFNDVSYPHMDNNESTF